MNNRIYTQDVFVNEVEKLLNRVLYCEDCLQALDKGSTNLDNLDKTCPHCGSYEATGITKKRMRELKIKRLIDE